VHLVASKGWNCQYQLSELEKPFGEIYYLVKLTTKVILAPSLILIEFHNYHVTIFSAQLTLSLTYEPR
jgi:hypothetical protein